MIDQSLITPAQALNEIGRYIERTGLAMTRTFDRLETAAKRAPLLAALKSLRTASSLHDSATPQVIDLSAVWYPSPDEAPNAAVGLMRFAANTAQYDAAEADLRELGVASIVATLDADRGRSGGSAFEQSVANTLAGLPDYGAGAMLDSSIVAATFRGYCRADGLLHDLIDSAVLAVRDEARQLAASEEESLLWWAAGSAVMALASIGIALSLARSISRPLKDLASYAANVNEGNLDAEPSATRNRGPRETQVAFATFSELVANLQLLDAKTNALAHCDFDDPILQEPLPGRLGQVAGELGGVAVGLDRRARSVANPPGPPDNSRLADRDRQSTCGDLSHSGRNAPRCANRCDGCRAVRRSQ